MTALAASAALFLFLVSILSIATVIFAPFLIGAFLLGLYGVLAGENQRKSEARSGQPPGTWRERT